MIGGGEKGKTENEENEKYGGKMEGEDIGTGKKEKREKGKERRGRGKG